jgi:hypothetical protein
MKYVYAVSYAYDYEGETLEGLYFTLMQARSHPGSEFGRKVVRRVPICNKPHSRLTEKQRGAMEGKEL